MTKHNAVNPDLKEERDKVEFDVEEFTNWYYKGAENVADRRFLGKFLALKLPSSHGIS